MLSSAAVDAAGRALEAVRRRLRAGAAGRARVSHAGTAIPFQRGKEGGDVSDFDKFWALWRSEHSKADVGTAVIAVREFFERDLDAAVALRTREAAALACGCPCHQGVS